MFDIFIAFLNLNYLSVFIIMLVSVRVKLTKGPDLLKCLSLANALLTSTLTPKSTVG